MDQQVKGASKRNLIKERVAQANRKTFEKLASLNPKPSDLTKSRPLRAVPIYVAKYLDDFWLGVKG